MKIAVDFDGTIVEHKYPEIGKPVLFAFDALKELQKRGHKLVLWTYRAGQELEQAIEFCKKNGIEFYAVNKSYPDSPEKFNILLGMAYDILDITNFYIPVRFFTWENNPPENTKKANLEPPPFNFTSYDINIVRNTAEPMGERATVKLL